MSRRYDDRRWPPRRARQTTGATGLTGGETRIERDSMGEMEVPADALYGASTQRAVLNFPICGQPMPRRFLRALALSSSPPRRPTTGSACSTA